MKMSKTKENLISSFDCFFIHSLFNSRPCLMLYIVYFMVSWCLFYWQKMDRLLWFCQKRDLECTKYSIPQLFQGRAPYPLPMKRSHYCVSVTTTASPSLPVIPSSGNGIAVFLQATTGELVPTFCNRSSTPYSLLKRLIRVFSFYQLQRNMIFEKGSMDNEILMMCY